MIFNMHIHLCIYDTSICFFRRIIEVYTIVIELYIIYMPITLNSNEISQKYCLNIMIFNF